MGPFSAANRRTNLDFKNQRLVKFYIVTGYAVARAFRKAHRKGILLRRTTILERAGCEETRAHYAATAFGAGVAAGDEWEALGAEGWEELE